MVDRSVQFPNRYRVVPVGGTSDIVDLVPAPGEIQAEGTAINKASLLSDAVAALFGLNTTAFPNDVLSVINTRINGKAPTNHATTAQTYGVGTAQNFGHLKLSDSLGSLGVSGGTAVTPLAVNNAITAATTKMMTGSYGGNGTYGWNNRNTLTFPYEPNIIFIIDTSTSIDAQYRSVLCSSIFIKPSAQGMCLGALGTGTLSYTYSYPIDVIWNEKTVSWYFTQNNPGQQMNQSGHGYYYFAI